MLGKFAKTVAVTAMAAGSVLLSAGGASAAHCVDPDTGTSPGFSYFGNDHNQEAAHGNEGVNNGAHSPGASSCNDIGSPSTRAPGQNR